MSHPEDLSDIFIHFKSFQNFKKDIFPSFKGKFNQLRVTFIKFFPNYLVDIKKTNLVPSLLSFRHPPTRLLEWR